MSRLTILNPDDGTFRLQFTSNDLKKSVSEEMKANASADKVRRQIRTNFRNVGVEP